jgi:nucleosome binding factor SPN SPT16 subunit
MKTVNESPYEFFQQGGWSFLGTGDEVRYISNI